VLRDLQRLLTAAPLLPCLILAAGCSASVDVASEQISPPSSAEKSSKVVAVELLIKPSPAAPTVEPEEEKVVEMTSDWKFMVNAAGDLQRQQHTSAHPR
jgi:hypothetical protein